MTKEFKLSKPELLKLASDILVKDYLEKRTKDHAQWIVNADTAWKNNNTWLPCPTMPAYPSSAEIILKAEELNKSINGESKSTIETEKEQLPEETATVSTPATIDENTLTSFVSSPYQTLLINGFKQQLDNI
jgi:hypothetical protein